MDPEAQTPAEAAAEAALVAVGTDDGSVSLVNFIRGHVGHRLQHLKGLHSGSVKCVAFSPNAKLLATASNDHSVSIIDMKTCKRVRHLDELHADQLHSIAWSPDSAMLLMGCQDGTASLVDVATGDRIHHYEGLHEDFVRCVAYSADGFYAASGRATAAFRLSVRVRASESST